MLSEMKCSFFRWHSDQVIRIQVYVSVSCPVDTGTAGFSEESEHHSRKENVYILQQQID